MDKRRGCPAQGLYPGLAVGQTRVPGMTFHPDFERRLYAIMSAQAFFFRAKNALNALRASSDFSRSPK